MKLQNISYILSFLLWSSIAQSHDVRVPTTIGELPLEKISHNIYLVHAPLQGINEINEGFIANTGFIVTNTGVVVIDPGSSVQIGRKLLEKIAEVTDNPVTAVINTHVHGDHWLGNQAVVEKFPDAVIYAHEKMIERLNRGEGEQWLEVVQSLTKGAVLGTKVVVPNVGLKGGELIKFGDTDLEIYYKGKAHTDTDIMIEVKTEKTLFLGDIVMVGRISSQAQDSDIKGQIDAIKFALDTMNKTFIPGHGKSGGRDVPEKALSFLTDLYASVKKYYEEGLSDFSMKERVIEDLSEYSKWSGFESIGRVISFTYLKVEEESF